MQMFKFFLLICFPTLLFSQDLKTSNNSNSPIRTDTLSTAIIDSINVATYNLTNSKNKKSHILSQKGINKLFAQKVAYFLSGSNDLSLFKSYASTNSDDGRLFLGYNIAFPKNSKNDFYRHILTLGTETNIKDGFSSFVEKDKFKENIGLKVKYVLLGKGSVFFNGSQHENFYRKRTKNVKNISDEIIIPKNALLASIDKIKDKDAYQTIVKAGLKEA